MSSNPANTHRRNRWARWLVGLAILFALGGGGAWFTARAAAQVALDRWLEAQQRMFGRRWTCESQTFGGFPWRLDFGCSGLKLEIANRRGLQWVRAPRLSMTALLVDPFSVDARLSGPLEYVIRDAPSPAPIRWAEMRFDIAWGLQGMRGLITKAIDVEIAAGRIGAMTLDIHAGVDQTVEIALEVNAIASPLVARTTGSDEPAALNVSARMDRSELIYLDDFLGSLEDWRNAGGKLDLARIRAQQADMAAEAKGVLQLDDVRRLRGSLTVSASNMDEVLKRYGVSPAALSIGNALSGLLARRQQGAAAAQPPQLSVPVELKNGRASIGPIRLPVALQPLY